MDANHLGLGPQMQPWQVWRLSTVKIERDFAFQFPFIMSPRILGNPANMGDIDMWYIHSSVPRLDIQTHIT